MFRGCGKEEMKQAGQLLCREMSGPAFKDTIEKDL
jgi:hypothetical protein